METIKVKELYALFCKDTNSVVTAGEEGCIFFKEKGEMQPAAIVFHTKASAFLSWQWHIDYYGDNYNEDNLEIVKLEIDDETND